MMDEVLAVAIAGFVLSLIALEAMDDDPTMELPIFPQMGVGSRHPEIPPERMRLKKPPGAW
jgi:hypothetical protein